MGYLTFDLWPKEIMKLWSIWSGGRSPSKIYQNQSLINFDEFFEMCWYLPKVGFADPTADDLGDIFQTAGQWHADSYYDSLLWQLGLFVGDSYHTAFPNEEQGLGWHVRWISDVSSYIALFWIGTTTGCTFSVCRFQTCDVLLAQQSTDSVRHGTVPQFNQLIKCNVAMYSTASASTLFGPY